VADKIFGISLRDQRIKWLLVAVLAAVLLAVIVWPGDAPPAESRAGLTGALQNAAAHRSAPASSKAAVDTAAKTAGTKSHQRPKVSASSEDELERTLKFNPFAPRPALQTLVAGETTASGQAQEQLAEKTRALAAQQRLSEFRGKKVSVVLRSSAGGSAALIGGRLVREGEIVDGIRVLSISTDGIVVEAVTAP
jgi:cytoskeletal protein RodZ